MTTPQSISLGCRLNAYESERMTSLAAQHGSKNVVVINTCAVTSEAVRQSRQAIRKAQRHNPEAEIIATGCAVQLDPQGFGAMLEVSRTIGNADKLSPAAWQSDLAVSDVQATTTLPEGPEPLLPPQVRTHLEVQNGCDHRCTFCIIPYGRGQARSKPPPIIVKEALPLIEQGAREIVLTGVDLTSYGPDLGAGMTLADAIEALLEALPDDIRLRLSSIDGAEIDDRLFALVTQEARIAPYLHLSLQAGDNMILKRMKRRHSREDAIDLCARLKTARPEIAFGADLMAGFPTETATMFENSLALIDDCALTYVHVFPFSPRKGTPAALMPQIDRTEIKSRAARLRAAADQALNEHLAGKVNTRQSVLVEQSTAQVALGKTPDFTAVRIAHALPVGAEIPIMITGIGERELLATPLLGTENTHHG